VARLASGLLVLAVLTWALPVVTADDAKNDLESRVAALEKLLKHFRRGCPSFQYWPVLGSSSAA
jgi:hypothetical protein